MDNSLISLYDAYFTESHNSAKYIGMAKAPKGIAVLVKDSGLVEHYREDLALKCSYLENLAPMMQFKELDACAPAIRYVRKLLNEKPDITWGSGLSRDPTTAEQERLDTLRRDNKHIAGSEFGADEGGDSFIGDLLDGD